MSQTTMYDGKVNSPDTTISETYTSGDDHIHVTELSVFPTAPNLCTIGSSSDAVTYLYTGKSGTSGAGTLTGVTVVEGTAKTWSSTTVIARNFTAYDHNTFKANIEDLNTVSWFGL